MLEVQPLGDAPVPDREGSAPRAAGRPYPKGYTAPPGMRAAIADAHRTRLPLTLALAVLDLASAVAATILAAWALLLSPLLVPVSAVLLVVAARQMRGLECLVHEASHFNWSRRRRRLNDGLAAVLAGGPTGATIASYRTSHLLHHGRFGTPDDPDRERYEDLDLERVDRRSAWGLLRDVIVRLPRYEAGWFAAMKAQPHQVLIPVVATSAATGVLGNLVLGTATGVLSGVCWLAGFFLALPVLRFLGEADEHVYSDSDTVFDATITNLGRCQRLLLHPHNDGYHTVHHMWPGVPHHSIRKLHYLLLAGDPDGYARRLRHRTRLLEPPRHGVG